MRRNCGYIFLVALACAALLPSCDGLKYGQNASLEIRLASDSRMKTIKPDMDLPIVSYDIYGTGPNGALFEALGISAASYVQEKLAEGDWLVYGEGKNASGEILVRSPSSSVKLSAGTTARVSLLCVPLAGAGQLSLTLSWPSDAVTTPVIEASLSDPDSASEPNSLDFALSGVSSAAYTSDMEFSSGFYILSLKLKDEALGGQLLWSRVEAVQIYKDKSTEAVWSLSAADLDDAHLPWLVLGLDADTKSPVSVSLSGISAELSAGEDMTVSASANPAADGWSWYLDGDTVNGASASSLTTGAQLAPGTAHSLAAVATRGDLAGSANGQFLMRMVSVATLAGSGDAGAEDGTGAAASFSYPSGVAVDSGGDVFVADLYNNQIRKITTAGIVSTYAGLNESGALDGTIEAATFNLPSDIAIDAAGNLYVADVGNNMIRKITKDPVVVSTYAGATAAGSSDGSSADARFDAPSGIAIDSAGNLYVADTNNNTVRQIAIGGIVSTIAGTGVSGFADGAQNLARFSQPGDVAVDSTGAIYVADSGNNRIRKIAGGNVSTVAGTGEQGSSDGPALEATFNCPTGVEVDDAGCLYIADSGGNRIRKLGPSGTVITLAGTGAEGSDDGPYSEATFALPSRLAVGASGTVYVADTNSQKIRTIAQ